MIRSMLLVVALLILPQDPADKIRALVENLGSEEIAKREKAAADLVALGVPALTVLRQHEGKSAGDVKTALQSVIKRIERAARLEKLLGSAPTVTLKVREAEVKKVVAEMARQSGLNIGGFFLDPSMRVTLACDRVPAWKAVDDLCRAHGGLGAGYSARSIVVEGGLDRGTAVTLHRSFGFHFASPRRLAEGKLWLQGILTYPPGLPVWSSTLEFDEFTDNLGTSLSM